MIAQFNRYTEITTYSGNTKVYIFRKSKSTSTYKKQWILQKILGVALIVISVAGCIISPEDCGGYLLSGFMGIARIVCD